MNEASQRECVSLAAPSSAPCRRQTVSLVHQTQLRDQRRKRTHKGRPEHGKAQNETKKRPSECHLPGRMPPPVKLCRNRIFLNFVATSQACHRARDSTPAPSMVSLCSPSDTPRRESHITTYPEDTQSVSRVLLFAGRSCC